MVLRYSSAAHVLRLLLEAGAIRSGEEMGRVLGLSRAAVSKAVVGLRSQGFIIRASTRLGYELLSEPDLVLPTRVEARLAPGSLGTPLCHFFSLDSTNLEARRRAEHGAPHGTCLVAEHQSAGRGRLDRRWTAPKGTCLLFSLLLRPAMSLDRVFSLTNLAALALCRAIEGMSGLTPFIKWPNDLFLKGRKLAGILTEFTCRADRLDHVVVGVGLNVNLTAGQLKKLPAPAHSLKAASGRAWDRAQLLARILEEVGKLYPAVETGKWRELDQEYKRRSLLTDRKVKVRDGRSILTGLARGVAPDGALLLEESPGRITQVRYGDVSTLNVEGKHFRTGKG